MTLRQHLNLLEAAAQLEKISLDKLPYPMSALEPAVSRDTVRIHYDILTKKYFKKYDETGDLFQKAGAVLHNEFFWPMLQKYNRKNSPSSELEAQIKKAHGSLKAFKEQVSESAAGLQGNGWVFVMQDLQIVTVQNHVIRPGIVLGVDLWEHSTSDYEFDRAAFLDEFWNIVNWDLFEERVNP